MRNILELGTFSAKWQATKLTQRSVAFLHAKDRDSERKSGQQIHSQEGEKKPATTLGIKLTKAVKDLHKDYSWTGRIDMVKMALLWKPSTNLVPSQSKCSLSSS